MQKHGFIIKYKKKKAQNKKIINFTYSYRCWGFLCAFLLFYSLLFFFQPDKIELSRVQ